MWLFQNPATMTFPVQSMMRAELGILTAVRVPTAVILPREVSTTAFGMAAVVGEG
jgi:hypothetical protein